MIDWGAEERRLLTEALDDVLTGYPITTADTFDPVIWRELAVTLGLGGLMLPIEAGGTAGGATEAAIVMRAMGRAGVREPVLETFVLPAALAAHRSPPVDALFDRIVAGTAIVAPAFAERGSRYDLHHVSASVAVDDGGLRIDGEKVLVFAGSLATDLLVTARTADDTLVLLLVPAVAPGVAVRRYRTIDGRDAADLVFDEVRVDASASIATGATALRIIDDMAALGTAATCAELAGAFARMIELTVAHVNERHQFGRPLAAFQALRHHLVDAWAIAQQADAMAEDAIGALAVPSPERERLVAAAKVFAGHARDLIGRYATQFHGAMGTTDETPVSTLFKRVTVGETRFGDRDHHLAQIIALGVPQSNDLSLDPADAAFRDEVRDFLATALTPELRARVDGQAGFICEPDLHRDWQAALRARGWDVPNWPAEHGGTGWSPVRRYIFGSEQAAAGAPFGAGMGINLCGPVIAAFGTPEQKAYFLPRIRSGEHYWAQGFSEPGSGSDLASLQLRAVRDGADYVVDGSKLWTTHAHHANWIFLLVRTGAGARKQEGLSFLLCPLDLPGITVRPITSMSGEREVNQVFFDGVRIPAEHLIGAEGQGWEIARYLLGFERGGRPFGAGLHRRLAEAADIAAREPDGRGGVVADDPVFRQRLAETAIGVLAANRTERRVRLRLQPGETMSLADASLLKLLASEGTQRVQALIMGAVGPYAAVDQRAALLPDPTADVVGPDHALTPTARYLNGRAYTIFGGASEVQRDILARAALGLV